MTKKRVVVVYVPVIHQGYINFIQSMEDKIEEVLLLGSEIIGIFDHLARKDLRAINPSLALLALKECGFSIPISLCTESTLISIANNKMVQVIMPDEHECRQVAKMFALTDVEYEKVFLRWHQGNILAQNQVTPEEKISIDDFNQRMMSAARTQAEQSLDWWRQVGAVLIQRGRVVLGAHNQHVPDERLPYVMGDPRSCSKKGLNIELSTAVHAEAGLIAEAAKRGIRTEGSLLYVTTFPCPPCSKLIAYSGVKTLYFQEGYSMLDGEEILRHQGVEIIQVLS